MMPRGSPDDIPDRTKTAQDRAGGSLARAIVALCRASGRLPLVQRVGSGARRAATNHLVVSDGCQCPPGFCMRRKHRGRCPSARRRSNGSAAGQLRGGPFRKRGRCEYHPAHAHQAGRIFRPCVGSTAFLSRYRWRARPAARRLRDVRPWAPLQCRRASRHPRAAACRASTGTVQLPLGESTTLKTEESTGTTKRTFSSITIQTRFPQCDGLFSSRSKWARSRAVTSPISRVNVEEVSPRRRSSWR